MIPQIIPLKEVTRLPLGFFIFIMVAILLLASPVIYGELATQMNMVLIVYVLLYLYAKIGFKRTEHPEQPIRAVLPMFLITFLGTLLVMVLIANVQFIQGMLAASTLEASIGFTLIFGFMHAGVKAYIEEDIFRARLSVMVGEAGQAILFGLFHFAILWAIFGFTLPLVLALAWLTALGYLWGRLENRTGIAGSTGSHYAYNLAAFGMLPLIIGGMVL